MATTSPMGRKEANYKQSQYLLGTLLLLGVVLLWVSSSFIMNSMFTTGGYNKPFLITYLCTASFTLYLVRPAYSELKRAKARRSGWAGLSPVKSDDDVETPYQVTDEIVRPDFCTRTRSRSISRVRSIPDIDHADHPLTTQQTAALALIFCGLWFTANWSMNAALGYTSVSSTTILSSMSGFFTLGVGACAGVDEFTTRKLGSVVLSVIGVVVVSKSDHDLNSGGGSSDPTLPAAPLVGDALALGSALAYAFYVILLKVRIRNEARVSFSLFFGFVGLFNILLIWPLGFLLNYTGVEPWEWPHGGKLWLSIAVNAGITFVSDILYLRAMLMTSPLAVTLGISLTIPLAMVGDVFRGTQLGGWKIYLGGALVLGSFVANGLMDLAETEEGEEEEQEERRLEGDGRGRGRGGEHEPLLAARGRIRESEVEAG